MNKKLIINIILTFGLCFLTHNIYKWIPNNLTAIFFPTNESVWEHMKMLFTTYLISGFIIYIIFDKRNFALSSLIVGIGGIILYLILFLPLNTTSKIAIFGTLIIDIIIFEYIRLKLINKVYNIKYNILAYILIIGVYILFVYLTFKPLKNDLFKDKITNQYGINTYILYTKREQ